MAKYLLLALLCAFLSACSPGHSTNSRSPSNYSIRNDPLTIVMSEAGGNLSAGYWNLSVNSAGQAELVVQSLRGDKRTSLQIPIAEFGKLREMIIREFFFELNDDYGERVPDGSTQSITIVVGGQSKTVRLHFLMNWVNSEPAKLREPARAVRVGMLIRSWFDDPDAVDSREFDQRILDAVDRLDQ